jgi:hypothetical protein
MIYSTRPPSPPLINIGCCHVGGKYEKGKEKGRNVKEKGRTRKDTENIAIKRIK